jgi:hypothetical protein
MIPARDERDTRAFFDVAPVIFILKKILNARKNYYSSFLQKKSRKNEKVLSLRFFFLLFVNKYCPTLMQRFFLSSLPPLYKFCTSTNQVKHLEVTSNWGI